MRFRVAACVLSLLFSSAACGGGLVSAASPPPTPAASSQEPSDAPAPVSPSQEPSDPPASASPSSSPSKPAAQAGPRTVCGEVQPLNDGPLAVVAVGAGRVDCKEAMSVFRAYYRSDTPKQGSAGIATVKGWRCAGNSAAQASTTGRLSTCSKESVKIVADVIP
ncbi:hypothetical protein ABZ897_24010 [Nonomuraea sp. NPDC046802]|uniref:hypothetical protein n=1 Tax=Nonomuraea sp. NPDC046802 TaxID=3154919 RepID=UPI0034119D4D